LVFWITQAKYHPGYLLGNTTVETPNSHKRLYIMGVMAQQQFTRPEVPFLLICNPRLKYIIATVPAPRAESPIMQLSGPHTEFWKRQGVTTPAKYSGFLLS
jgi:hypothetical protein